ncbi:DUF4926 domain-containing protein [Olsenella phocaeensis]|uniref:DUF4926 domain-containing protein n=1 Tax=Olsenella phocaeensis TaxID=1852385 RepID=UPI003A8CE312
MNELDCVRLTRDFEDLKAGVEGAIVYKYNDDDFEVEFFDADHETIGVYTISRDYLEVTWTFNR